ncbi:MAG: hypothetical protein EPN88_10900 [Bacteroidetes bacterium]|nr:MAG: hypothetical protein EPN88_10900 [Bacteroidota bacterium]
MKKFVIFLIIFCSSSQFIHSQNKPSKRSDILGIEKLDSISYLNKRILKLDNQINIINDVLKTSTFEFQKKIDSINNLVIDKKIEESLKPAVSAINIQNSLIDGFGTLYTYITGLIGILAFMLPLLVYFFSIRPARKQIRKSKKIIEDMNMNLDIKFNEYILKNKEQQINSALVNIKGQDKFLRSTAFNFLQYSINQSDLSDNQLHEIYKLLAFKNDLDENSKIILSNILCCKKNQYSEEYFKVVVVNEKAPLKLIGLHYFLFAGFEQYMEDISNMILDSENPEDEYIQILLYLSSQAPREIVKIINYNNLNSKLSDEEMGKVKEELDDSKYDSIRKEINESQLFNVKN